MPVQYVPELDEHVQISTLEDAEWLDWVTDLETTIGHDLDGDLTADGYNLDWIYTLWKAGHSVDAALALVNTAKRDTPQLVS